MELTSANRQTCY